MEAKDLIKELAIEMETNFKNLNDNRQPLISEDMEDFNNISRAEKVANIKAMVKAGIYEVPSKDVANKLLKMLF